MMKISIVARVDGGVAQYFDLNIFVPQEDLSLQIVEKKDGVTIMHGFPLVIFSAPKTAPPAEPLTPEQRIVELEAEVARLKGFSDD